MVFTSLPHVADGNSSQHSDIPVAEPDEACPCLTPEANHKPTTVKNGDAGGSGGGTGLVPCQPHHHHRYRGLSRHWRQYRVLVWKNLLVRRRTPSMLVAELVFPLLFIFILVGFRSQDVVQREPACHVQAQSMPSMGLLHFLQSTVCNFNYTCQPTEPDGLVLLADQSPMFFLLNNLTELLSDVDVKKSVTSVLKGDSLTAHLDSLFRAAPKLLRAYTALIDVTSAWQQILSGNVTQLTRVGQLSQLVCGQSPTRNDLGLTAQFIEQSEIVNFTELLRRVNFSAESASAATTTTTATTKPSEDEPHSGRVRAHRLNLCPTIGYLLTWPPAAKRVGRLRHFLFGQVAYYPATRITSLLMHRVSTVHRLLDEVKTVLLPLYFNTTRPWLVRRLSDIGTDSSLRNQLRLCSYSSLLVGGQLAEACAQLTGLLTAGQSSALHWSHLLDDLDWYVGVVEEILNCLPAPSDRFQAFSNLTQFHRFLEASQPDRLHAPIGVIFEGLEPSESDSSQVVSLVLRHNPGLVDTTYRYKVLDRYRSQVPRRDPDSDMKYFTSGFIDLQEQLSRAVVASMHSNRGHFPGVQMRLFPSPTFLRDRLFSFFTFTLPQLMVLSWSLTVVSAVKNMVDEKEHGLLYVQVTNLGVPHLLIWAAWFTVPFLLAGTTSLVLIVVLKLGGIFPLADVSLLYAYQLSYIVSVLAYAAVCASLFTRANLAAVFAGCCYFICFVPAPLLQRYENFISRWLILVGSLLPQVSHTFGWSHLVRMEADVAADGPTGARWGNLAYSGRDAHLSMTVAFALLWVATLLQFATAIWLIPWMLELKLWANAYFSEIYVTRVRPGTTESSSQLLMNEINGSTESAGPVDRDRFSPPPPYNQASIIVDRVSKRYRYSRNLALNDVSLRFYPNEIGVLLGHNGTGKTTMISILSGSLQATHGAVTISGVNTSRQPELARQHIGYCPQHEVLYSELTVGEHIRFYGSLKDLGRQELDIDSWLDKFGFAEKRNSLSKHLSGGQRRRLSVCLAFLGSPSVVLLDEPTASVDPLYKRVIWDTVLSMRGDNRTILLSTHHMGEADFLADRIAILARGRLCSLGTSMALKARYSEGYRLLLEQGRDHSCDALSLPPVMSVITRFVPGARLISRKQNSLVILLPSCGAYEAQFVLLFEHLEAILMDRQLPPGPLETFTRFSITDATLDDVFLAVSDGDHCEVMNNKADEYEVNSSLIRPREGNHIATETDALLTSDQAPDRVQPRGSPTGAERRPSWRLANQFALIVQTRCYHLLRNKLLWLFEFLLPCLIFLLSVVVATVYRPEIEQPAMDLHPWLMSSRKKVGCVSFFSDDAARSMVNQPAEGADLTAYLRALKDPFSWTSPACPPRDYVGRPPQFIPPCRTDGADSPWTRDDELQVPPYRRLPTDDWLLNLTTFNVSQYLQSRSPLPFTGDLFGGISLAAGDQTSVSTSTLSRLFLVLRDWLVTATADPMERLSADNNTNDFTASCLVDSFSMNLSEVLQLLLPPAHQLHVWYNNKGYAASPAYLNILHNLELRLATSGVSASALVVVNYPQPFPKYSFTSSMRDSMMLDAGFVLFFLLALSSIPGNFAVLLVSERQLGVKHLQRVSGLRPLIYWLANFVADFFIYLATTGVCVVILVAFQKTAYVSDEVVGPFVCLLLLFQCAMITFVQLTTFCFHKPSTAYVVISAVNVLISSLTTSVSLLLEVFSLQEPSLRHATVIVQRALLVFPHYCLGSAIYDLAVLHFLRRYDLMTSALARPFVGYQSVWQLVGFRLVCLAGQTLVYSLAILCVEHHDWLLRWLMHLFCCCCCGSKGSRGECGLCKRLVSCTGRLTCCPPLDWVLPVGQGRAENKCGVEASHDSPGVPLTTRGHPLRLNQLSKRYRGQNTYAISRLDLAVRPGECFGLLGTNGAGKSTTFALLTGGHSVSPGSVSMNGYDLATRPGRAQRSVGYCPQGHALHPFLTVRETLYRYARLRCLPAAHLPRLVSGWLETFGLSAGHADRLVSRLSGGTKRKLSAAIAFIGTPGLLLLDEPSNGMDPASKRLFWAVTQKVLREGCSVLLSSHCMQECETLCNRIGLLDNGRLQCEGTPLELKTRFGVGYLVELELTASFVAGFGRTAAGDLASAVLALLVVETNQAAAEITLLQRPGTSSYRRLQFQFSGQGRLSRLFSVLGRLRYELSVVHRFSVKAGTLEDAFIGFVCDRRSSVSSTASLLVKSRPPNHHLHKAVGGGTADGLPV